MSTLTVSLPESVHNQLQRLADREGVSIDQLAASALTEKVAALLTNDYLTQRAQRGSRRNFKQALAKIKMSNRTSPINHKLLFLTTTTGYSTAQSTKTCCSFAKAPPPPLTSTPCPTCSEPAKKTASYSTGDGQSSCL